MRPYERNHEHKSNHAFKRSHNSRLAIGKSREIQVLIPQEIEYRLQRFIAENSLPSRDFVVIEAITKYLDSFETPLEQKRRDQRELAEVPPLTREELPL